MVKTLLAELDLVCPHCDALAPPRSDACPACGEGLGQGAPADLPTAEHLAAPTPLDAFKRSDAELQVLRGTAEPGSLLPIPAEGASIGRSEGDHLFPDDPSLSPLAATFAYRSDILFVRPDGPEVFLRIAHHTRIEAGETFALGDHLLRLAAILSAPPKPVEPDIHGSSLPHEGPLLVVEILLAGGRAGRRYLLPSPIHIGRGEGELLLPGDRFVSGRHCALHLDGEQVILEDLTSTNGTFIRLPPGVWRPLRRGDTLRLGQNILRLR